MNSIVRLRTHTPPSHIQSLQLTDLLWPRGTYGGPWPPIFQEPSNPNVNTCDGIGCGTGWREEERRSVRGVKPVSQPGCRNLPVTGINPGINPVIK